MTDTWKKLPLQQSRTTPVLLHKCTTSKTGYELLVTDLIYIWCEKLNYNEILKRASRNDTSIDPSEDEEQYTVFIEKLSNGLREQKDSKISLGSGSKDTDLKLNATIKLPAPLDPLQWTFHLSRLPQNSLSEQIILPLLREGVSREARIKSLFGRLKEKDWVLGKLFDKIESSGVDFSTVLPGMTGVRPSRKESAFSQASNVVKGVAPFDEKAWNDEFQRRDATHNLGLNIVEEISTHSNYLELHFGSSNDWWNQLEVAPPSPEPQQKLTESKGSTHNDESSTEDDEFEVRQRLGCSTLLPLKC